MNEDLPVPEPYRVTVPRLALDELRAFLFGIPPGWYLTADLHRRYLAWAEREGKKEVATVKTLAESIAANMTPKPEKRYAHGHRVVWHIEARHTRPLTKEEEFAEGRKWFTDTSGRGKS